MSLFGLFQAARRSPTLRGRIAFLTSMLILFVSGGLALFINLYAWVETPTSQTIPLSMPRPATPTRLPRQLEDAYRLEQVLPLPTDTPVIVTDPAQQAFSMQHEDKVRQTMLAQLATVSLVVFGVIAILGGLLAYWVSGRALRPLQQVSDTVRHIRAGTLSSRVRLENPSTELKDLVQALDSMLGNLEHSFNQQGHFASLAAHELRAPLAALRTNVEVLYHDPNATMDDYRRIMPSVTETLTRMDRLISDLLVMAKDQQSLARQEIDLIPLLADVLDSLSCLAAEHRVKLELRHADDASPMVHGEPILLARLFGNIVENAIRYNHPEGRVAVVVEQHGYKVSVTVQDTGIGMSAQDQTSIFRQFYRASHSKQLYRGGVGLGLSIASHVAKLHDGEIAFESAPGTGSTFRVQLPLYSTSN
jgi:signal transduction histidine kinase